MRGINACPERKIILKFENISRHLLTNTLIKFIEPKGELVLNEPRLLPKYNNELKIKIWQSPSPLTSQPVRYNPFSLAGIIIKSENAILDNQLFDYDEPAGFYFWGEVSCPDMAKRLRKLAKEGRETEIIDSTRKGVNWRSRYCETIKKTVEACLGPLVQKKKKELEAGIKKEVPQETKKILKNICQLLDNLARKEFKEWEAPLDKEFEELTVFPDFVNIEAGAPRTLSIYSPYGLIQIAGSRVSVHSDSDEVKILLPGTKRLGLSWDFDLEKHPKNSNTWYKFFNIVGREIGKEGYIYCKLGNQQVTVPVRIVKELSHRGKRKNKGGFISNINFDEILNPIQRVQYLEDAGEIKIFVKFPSVNRYFSSGFDEIEESEGSRTLLAELVGESFCGTLARKKLVNNGFMSNLTGPEGQIDAFNSEINEMQRKYLDKIHEIFLNWHLYK